MCMTDVKEDMVMVRAPEGTKLRDPKRLQLKVEARTAPRLLVYYEATAGVIFPFQTCWMCAPLGRRVRRAHLRKEVTTLANNRV